MGRVPIEALRPLLGAGLALCPIPAAAQSFHVDFQPAGSPSGSPPATYGAATGAPGAWNVVTSTGPTSLVATDGLASAVTLTESSLPPVAFVAHDFPSTSGDDAALLDDQYRPEDFTAVWHFDGLDPGDYALTTIVLAYGNAQPLDVSVLGANEGAQLVSGAWGGSYTQGQNFARHTKTVTDGMLSVIVTVLTLGDHVQLSGLQLVRRDGPGAPFCTGDGLDPQLTASCPCANLGAPGHGCANSVEPAGALLGTGGTSSPDTAVLHGSGMPGTSTALYLKSDGTIAAGLVLGDGLRCIGGQIVRLRTQVNSGGTSQYPLPGQLPLSVRGQTPPGSGLVAYYQAYYRNANMSYCTSETFNLTNGVLIVW